MHLYPARGAGNVLTMILGTPSLHEAHANGAHFGQLVHSLKSQVNRLCQQLGELLVIKYLEAARWRDLAYSGWVEPMGVVAVPALDKYGTFTEAFSKDLAPYVEQVYTFADVPACIFDGRVAIDIREQAEAEPVGTCGRVCKAIHYHMGLVSMEGLPNTIIEFIVRNGTPKWWLLVLHLYRCTI